MSFPIELDCEWIASISKRKRRERGNGIDWWINIINIAIYERKKCGLWQMTISYTIS